MVTNGNGESELTFGVQKGEEKKEVEIQLDLARKLMDELPGEIYASAAKDAETQSSIHTYRVMKLDEAEIKRRVTRQYAYAQGILFPVKDMPLPENSFTVGMKGEIHFEPIDWCLGVMVESDNGLTYGAHILADDHPDPSHHEKAAESFVGQLRRFYLSKTAAKISFISPHAGDTVQHSAIIKKIQATFPSSEAVLLRRGVV